MRLGWLLQQSDPVTSWPVLPWRTGENREQGLWAAGEGDIRRGLGPSEAKQ